MRPTRRSQPYREGLNLGDPFVSQMMRRGAPMNFPNPAARRQQMLKRARLAQLLARLRG